jgi:hypothetical protein
MFVGYKKALSIPDRVPVIVTLEIPLSSRNNIYRKNSIRDREFAKHRCESAWVKRIRDPITGKDYQGAISMAAPKDVAPLMYYVGRFVKSDSYDSMESRVCGSGIHFFLSYTRALYYRAPFSVNCFQVWHDNGGMRYYGETTRNVFNGLFVEYDREGKVIKEFRIENNVIRTAWIYQWNTVLSYDLMKNFVGKPVLQHKKLRETFYDMQSIYDVIPFLKSY